MKDIDKLLIKLDKLNKPNKPRGRRDAANADLMENYAKHFSEKSEQNRKLKVAFFILVFVFLFVFIVLLLAISLVAVSKDAKDGVDIGIIIASIASALTSMIALPMLIGQYLFPKGEDGELLNYMTKMHVEDKDYYQMEKGFNAQDEEATQSFISDVHIGSKKDE